MQELIAFNESIFSSINQIFHKNELYYYIDGQDTSKSNWMRYVNPAHSPSEQNLVACQVKFDIYFYTIKPIPAGTELFVWYCREYADRLNYPLSADNLLSRCKYHHIYICMWDYAMNMFVNLVI